MKSAAVPLTVILLMLGIAWAGDLAWAGGQAKPAVEAKSLRPESRVWILRGLLSEFVTLRKGLPRGDKGLPLDTQGKIDEQELTRLITNNGIAVRPGEIVQITKIDFGKKEIVFDVNGGGKRKRKWYQNLEVGMGGSTRPVNTGQSTELAAGSSIALQFGGPIPDITVDDLKAMLTPVFDFTRRSATVLYTESLPKEIQEAIKNSQVLVGMDREMVLASKGRPTRKHRERRRDGVEGEDWIYGTPPAKVMFVTFDGDQVLEVREFTPGIASEAARAAEGTKPSPAGDQPATASPATAPVKPPAVPAAPAPSGPGPAPAPAPPPRP